MTSRGDGAMSFRGKRDVIAQMLREEIVQGVLPIGARIRQEEIALRYGVSPTPVREALGVLETQGFVTREAHRGVTVADFAGSFDQVYRLREALEGLATELSVTNMSPEGVAELYSVVTQIEEAGREGDEAARHEAHTRFHQLLYGGCDFPALLDLIEIVWSRFPWDELLALPGLASRSDHRAIVDCAAEGDAVGAAAELQQHLRAVRDLLSRTLAARQVTTAADSDA